MNLSRTTSFSIVRRVVPTLFSLPYTPSLEHLCSACFIIFRGALGPSFLSTRRKAATPINQDSSHPIAPSCVCVPQGRACWFARSGHDARPVFFFFRRPAGRDEGRRRKKRVGPPSPPASLWSARPPPRTQNRAPLTAPNPKTTSSRPNTPASSHPIESSASFAFSRHPKSKRVPPPRLAPAPEVRQRERPKNAPWEPHRSRARAVLAGIRSLSCLKTRGAGPCGAGRGASGRVKRGRESRGGGAGSNR